MTAGLVPVDPTARWWERSDQDVPVVAPPPLPEHAAMPRALERDSEQLEAFAHAIAARPPLSARRFVALVLPPVIDVGVLAAVLWAGSEPFDDAWRLLALVAALLALIARQRIHRSAWRIVTGGLRSWIVRLLALGAIAWWLPALQTLERVPLLEWIALVPMAETAALLCVRGLWQFQARRPSAQRPALVVGAGDLAARVGQIIERRSDWGHRLVGFIEDRAPDRRSYHSVGRVVGSFDDVIDCVRRYHVRDVYMTLPLSQQPRLLALLDRLCDAGVSIYYVPDIVGVPVLHGRLRSFDGVPLVGLLESPFVGVNGVVKRLSDLVLSGLILLLVAPLMVVLALGVWLSSPGPVIFKQRRHGVDGREIVVYKFRSMTVTEDDAAVRQATRDDPRVTPFGAFLRRTSLDELPQFFNVLQGRMSIVGPRPHAVAHNDQYRQIIGAYMLRHKIKPGITGWAQVLGHRGETAEVGEMVARVACDIHYLRNWSLGLDLRIIARTVGLVFFDRKAY